MTYIKLDSEMKLTITSRDAIYRGDNLSKEIIFLIPMELCDGNIITESSTIFVSYISPDGNADMDILERSESMYNLEYYQYVLPVTCKMTRCPGKVLFWLQVCAGDPNKPSIAKSSECYITVNSSKSMDDCMSDHQLTALYKLKKLVEIASEDNTWDDISDETGRGTEDDNGSNWEDM